jgi:hypothetical protein
MCKTFIKLFEMKKQIILLFILIVIISAGCSLREDVTIELKGDFIPKKVLQAVVTAPPGAEILKVSWFAGDPASEKWELLEGIHTPEIVLLTGYAGKHLKCEITWTREHSGKEQTLSAVTASPVIYDGNPNTDWFKDAGVGVMVHFLQAVYASEGGSEEWNEIVNGFDVELFAENCLEAGAGYVMFALGQNDGYYCSPNSAYDSVVGTAPGDLCSHRDLPADLFEALDKRGIRMMVYLPGNPPIRNQKATEGFKYSFGKDSPTSQYTQARWEAVIREWSLRYGNKLSGWWFDGMYRGGIIETRSDMSLAHNISTHTLAAKAGNFNSIVTYNYGVDKIQSNSPYDDYSAGEESHIDQIPESRWVVDGVQWFLFTYLGDWWSKGGTRFNANDLTAWAKKVFQKEGVICFDIHADKSGAIDPDQILQVRAVREIFNEKAQ